jgi:hypothetical protein
MMGIPAEEFSVKVSLVFSIISISHPSMGDIHNVIPSLTTGPEVVQIIWVMYIHDGNTCRRMLGHRFLGFFNNNHLPPPVWRKYKSIY